MKIIIIGLGNYGGELAKELTSLGHEVIGVDRNEGKVESKKSCITISIAMDATDELALANLPLRESDLVIVAIGEDHESSILVTALMKQAGVPHLISRAFNPIQRAILEAIGVEKIIMPETESALRFAKQITYPGVYNSYSVSETHGIIEFIVPDTYIGKKIAELELQDNFSIQLIALKRMKQSVSILKNPTTEYVVLDGANAETQMLKNDILVVYGSDKMLRNLLKKLS